MKENGVGYGHNAPPVDEAALYEAAHEFSENTKTIAKLNERNKDLKDVIGSMFPNESGEQFHYISSKKMKVIFSQSEIRKFEQSILEELYPLGSEDTPDCMSIDYKVNARKFDALPADSLEKQLLMRALTRKPGLRKITVEIDDE